MYDSATQHVHWHGFTVYHFTGKERDAESGLDYFGARYYGSSMGRWMSPDWSAKQEPVPYSKLDNPQTLNLYQYMRNNPLSGADPDGHCDWCQKLWNGIKGDGFQTNAQLADQRAAQVTETETYTPIVNEQTTTVQVDMTNGVVVQGGVNYSVGGAGASYVPSTGAIYGTATVGTPGTGAYAAVGLTTDPNQAGPSASVSAFAGVGATASVAPNGAVTTGVGVGTPGAGAAVGLTTQIGQVAPATVSVKITAIPAQSAIPIGDGLYTQEDWPH